MNAYESLIAERLFIDLAALYESSPHRLVYYYDGETLIKEAVNADPYSFIPHNHTSAVSWSDIDLYKILEFVEDALQSSSPFAYLSSGRIFVTLYFGDGRHSYVAYPFGDDKYPITGPYHGDLMLKELGGEGARWFGDDLSRLVDRVLQEKVLYW